MDFKTSSRWLFLVAICAIVGTSSWAPAALAKATFEQQRAEAQRNQDDSPEPDARQHHDVLVVEQQYQSWTRSVSDSARTLMTRPLVADTAVSQDQAWQVRPAARMPLHLTAPRRSRAFFLPTWPHAPPIMC